MDFTLLDLEDVNIINIKENNGFLQVFLEKNSSSAVCPSCNTPSTTIKDIRIRQIIHRPILDSLPVQLFIKKKRFKCLNPSCKTKSFTEQIRGLERYHIYTQAFKDFVSNMYKHSDFPTIKKRLYDDHKLDIPLSTIWYKLKDQIKDFFPQPQSITAKFIGIDDFSHCKGHNYAVALVIIQKDIHNKHQKSKIVDMVAGGKTTAAAEFLLKCVDPESVVACCIDIWEPFRTAIRKKLPNADIVVDKFHVIKLFNEYIQDLITRISPDLSIDDKELVAENKFALLLKGKEKLNDSQTHDLQTILNINPELSSIYNFKERFRLLYLIDDVNIVKNQLRIWLYEARRTNIEELISVANTYCEWFTEITNYWIHRISNGAIEGKINKIRTIQSKAYHYRNFHTLRYNVIKSEQSEL